MASSMPKHIAVLSLIIYVLKLCYTKIILLLIIILLLLLLLLLLSLSLLQKLVCLITKKK